LQCGSIIFSGFARVLWEALLAGQTQPVGGSPDYLVTLLVQLLGYTVAFLTGLTSGGVFSPV